MSDDGQNTNLNDPAFRFFGETFLELCLLPDPQCIIYPNLQATHCLTVSGGDAERAAQLIIHRHEQGQAIKDTRDRKVSGELSQL